MSVRRLCADQPASFAFTPENLDWCANEIKKYPDGRQASAVIALLWRGQEQNGGWVTEPMIRTIGDMLGMPYIRVLEVATFYTMFNLAPRGKYLLQVCKTTPCWLRGSDDVTGIVKAKLGVAPGQTTKDGLFSWMEVECLGACANAPVIQVNDDYYEDLDAAKTEALLDALARGEQPQIGSQTGRRSSEPEGGRTTLTGVSGGDR
ncbi:MAG: NADH-quinone oxidoreductase subunit NuoE [Alphaproteobacteria bacterium]|nr:NADH-quinone oxidoreductase subunit NuoE [Alphaproteobacteria bacterium]